jgi:hypothetical protein
MGMIDNTIIGGPLIAAQGAGRPWRHLGIEWQSPD